jgi:uncharacterized protein (DUF58 family)
MLTSRGLWFLMTILALLAVAMVGDYALLGLIGLTLLAWFLVAWLVFVVRVRVITGNLRVARQVRDERGPVTSLWTGRKFQVRVRLSSDAIFALPYVRLTDRLPVLLERVEGASHVEGAVSASQPLDLDYQVQCPFPGKARFDGVHLQVADLQGFFTRRLFVRRVRSYRVLPPLADARGRFPTVKRHNLIPLLGLHRHLRPGTGSELLDLRDYLPGDPPKKIAWKASARRDRLMTKEYESEVPLRCTVFVDISASVRIGMPGRSGLTRLTEITAAVAQATAASRDLTGICLFDEYQTRVLRPARGQRHLISVFNLLADAANLQPSTREAPLTHLLPLAYGLAQDIYPDLLEPDVNAFPRWLPWLFPQPAYTLRRRAPQVRSFWKRPGLWLRRALRYALLALRQALVARFLSFRARRHYRWRKHLAALLSVRYGLAPGGLALLLEDDERMALYLQRFLVEHQVPYPLPFYDPRGRYLYATPAKVEVLARALLRTVARGRDNELFVLMADLLELGDALAPLLRAARVALARHHQVLVVCPWPEGVPVPEGRDAPAGSLSWILQARGVQAVLERSTVARFHQAFFHLRQIFARLGVPVLCARSDESVELILNRLERLRIPGRGGW